MWIQNNRKVIIIIFSALTLLSLALLPNLRFSFDFEKFFPENDADLEFYKAFVKEFESDDNYLLIAVVNEKSIASPHFLKNVRDLTSEVSKLDFVNSATSLSSLQKPSFGPFGFTFSSLLNIEDSLVLQKEIELIRDQNGMLKRLISKDLKSTVVALKIKDHIQIEESAALMKGLNQIITKYSFQDYHFLGRAYFQTELSSLQKQEVIYSSVFSFIVVSFILFFIYRNLFLVFITLLSITLGLILFLGVLSILGRELDAMSALYPVLMLIVGSSDVIHILSKYLDELRKGKLVSRAMDVTIRQIGLATFFTSATTAVGFISLVTSRIGPVRGFGLNAAIGVLVAYLTIIFFTTALLTFFSPEKLRAHSRSFRFWDDVAMWFYSISKNHSKIYSFLALLIIVCCFGITKISTDYKLESSLPRNKKVSADFQFFEKNYSGYRPLEYVFFTKDSSNILDFETLSRITKFEHKILQSPYVESSTSLASVFDMTSSFIGPLSGETPKKYYNRIYPFFLATINSLPTILLNDKQNKTRISAQIKDVGADQIGIFSDEMNNWFNTNIDTSKYGVKYTGTGMVIDKNAKYVRESLLKGLGLALIIIGILMGIMYRNIKMVLLSLIPNVIPLIIAGAILGFLKIPLEPLTSITFVVVFGIAVDDTIHFLSKYRLALLSGLPKEDAIQVSFKESGKAIIFTTIVLFFGFMVMLFSYNPASVIVGGLISVTLFTAVFSDLILLPVLLRTFDIK